MNPLILGGLAIGALVLVASANKGQTKPSSHAPAPTSEKWRLVFGVYPGLESQEQLTEVEKFIRYAMPAVLEVDYPEKNTIEITIVGPKPVGEVGQTTTIGNYTFTLANKYKVD